MDKLAQSIERRRSTHKFVKLLLNKPLPIFLCGELSIQNHRLWFVGEVTFRPELALSLRAKRELVHTLG
ncbi:hypothetical protein BQ9231_00341 [Cedratvirus lausannensis]|uniref:Uncharacterized protein n=1 Tax=Cedratvirus lausannensis TaxID=2023205 RepID=A0A285PX67_9VIRU|nr:hypothetical protein BQ9231_00341 [Cedratvirus lausannensis]